MNKNIDDNSNKDLHCDSYIEKTYPCNRLSRWEDVTSAYGI